MPDRSDLSFWGWGLSSHFPDRAVRAQLAGQLSFLGLPGTSDLQIEDPPDIETLSLPRVRLPVPAQLAEFTTTDRHARARHTHGRAYPDILRGLRGDFRNAPDMVAFPRDEAEILSCLRWAQDQRVAVVPFGGGTSVVGGVECEGRGFAGVLCLDMGRMDRVLEVEPSSRSARIQAGATGPRLEQQLATHGLTLRHYPQSFEFSTLGGWIATRSGGHFATLTTHIDELVQSVRMLTPTGPMETRRLPASGAGPDPNRLILGSEGILGVITEAWMRVRPRPIYRSSASVGFTDFGQAVAATRALAQSALYPANCRLLDATEARLHSVCFDGRHILLLGFECADRPREADLDRALAIAQACGGEIADGPDHRKDSSTRGSSGAWRQAFLQAPYLHTTLVSLGLVIDTFETACTWDRFEELHQAITRAVHAAMDTHCGGGRIGCRFTHVYPDGPAPYYTFLAGGQNGDQLAAWQAIKAAASDAIAAHGGTITHHHAVGRTHRPWYQHEVPPTWLKSLHAAKASLDPAGILNPGVLLEPDLER